MTADGVIAGLLLFSALIHLLPIVGLVSATRVAGLYDVPVPGPDLAILLRHRALLFGLLGTALVWAAFDEGYREPVLVGALISDVGYLLLCLAHPGYNDALRRVLVADLLSIVALVAAGGLIVL